MTTQLVRCAKCGTVLDQPSDTPADARTPCPKCGSTMRQFDVHIRETLHFHSSVSHKAEHADAKKPYMEGFAGDELHRKSGRWMKKERLIDREKDQYREVVTDPNSGEVSHECEEPLSKHRGHGSDEKRMRSKLL